MLFFTVVCLSLYSTQPLGTRSLSLPRTYHFSIFLLISFGGNFLYLNSGSVHARQNLYHSAAPQPQPLWPPSLAHPVYQLSCPHATVSRCLALPNCLPPSLGWCPECSPPILLTWIAITFIPRISTWFLFFDLGAFPQLGGFFLCSLAQSHLHFCTCSVFTFLWK